MGIQSNDLAVGLPPFYGFFPKSWDFEKCTGLEWSSWLANSSPGSRCVVEGNLSHQAVGGSSTK